jgi:hypothetical protein
MILASREESASGSYLHSVRVSTYTVRSTNKSLVGILKERAHYKDQDVDGAIVIHKVRLKETRLEGVQGVHVTPDRDQCWVFCEHANEPPDIPRGLT